jgi:hypothetical protein
LRLLFLLAGKVFFQLPFPLLATFLFLLPFPILHSDSSYALLFEYVLNAFLFLADAAGCLIFFVLVEIIVAFICLRV